MRRLATAVVLSALALALPAAEPAHAAPSGTLSRGSAPNDLVANLTNDGVPIELLRLRLAAGFGVEGITVSGAPGSCGFNRAAGEIECGFTEPYWQRAVAVRFTTGPRYPDGRGAMLFVCREPCSDKDQGPFAVHGPSRPCPKSVMLVRPCADLFFRWRGARTAKVTPADFAAVSLRPFFDIRNDGPDDAAASRLAVTVGELPPKARLRRACVPPNDCTIPRIAAGRHYTANVIVGINEPGTVRLSARLTPRTPDPGPRPNAGSFAARLRSLPDSNAQRLRWLPVDNPPSFRGSSSGAVRTEVAIGKAERGAKVVGSRRSPRGCRWVRSRRVRFRRERGKHCDRPVWLRAKGKRRWRLRLRRPLPRGRYVLLSRAVHRTGAVESRFSRRDGNRMAFRVR